MNFKNELRFTSLMWVGILFILFQPQICAQDDSSTSYCGEPIVTVDAEGNTSICIVGFTGTLLADPGSFSFACSDSQLDGIQQVDNCFINVPCCPGDNLISISWSVLLASGSIINCSSIVVLPECTDDPCEGPDTDGDGICDPDDCWPEDPTITLGPGDPCDDGNPLTTDDTYNFDCDCIGNPIVPECEPDTDGDGVCDEVDCWPTNPDLTYGPGDPCDDGDTNTVNDQYNEDCDCEGVPNDCGDVDPDDGCPLTVDILNEDCTVTNIPPDPDDGCPLTLDFFDAANCIIVNQPPNVDDGCEGTMDSFDYINCVIVNEPLPCDDGDPSTVGDWYNADCECIGCDPCLMEGEEWEILCELLNGQK